MPVPAGPINLLQGKVLGGSSSVNGMMNVRGQRRTTGSARPGEAFEFPPPVEVLRDVDSPMAICTPSL
jgi:hypothetical protein